MLTVLYATFSVIVVITCAALCIALVRGANACTSKSNMFQLSETRSSRNYLFEG